MHDNIEFYTFASHASHRCGLCLQKSDVAWSVSAWPEPMEMSFEWQTCFGPKEPYLGVEIPMGNDTFEVVCARQQPLDSGLSAETISTFLLGFCHNTVSACWSRLLISSFLSLCNLATSSAKTFLKQLSSSCPPSSISSIQIHTTTLERFIYFYLRSYWNIPWFPNSTQFPQ